MATIMCLSEEVIAIILGYKNISVEDITNFRSTCTQFRYVLAKCESFRRKKFLQRWSYTKKLYDKMSKENEQKESEENKQKDKQSLRFIETGKNCARQLRNYASQIIHKHFYNNNPYPIDQCTSFQQVFQLDEHLDEIFSNPENFINNSFFIDEIKCLLTQSERSADCDLTERYYNKKMFHYLRQCLMKEKWERFEKQPHRKQLLERIATFVAQWLQPEKDVFFSCVKASLDTIAQGVLNCLREKHPDHSIFSTSAENFSYWKNNNIDDNHWNEAEGTHIMDILEEYIFGTLNFRRNKLGDTKLEYSMCIDNVLENKKGQEIILLVIYHSVARRLGLRCDVRCQYREERMCIFWKPNYATNSSENVRCFNINFNKFPDCLIKQQYFKEPSVRTVTQVLLEMVYTIFINLGWYNNTLMIMPSEMSNIYHRRDEARIHFKNAVQSNTRPMEVKFAVGMIVKYNQNECDQPTDKPSAGVIIGWHQYIDRHKFRFSKNKVWNPVLPLKICSNFSDKNQQPHYIILTEKNEMCYVNEGAITLTTPKLVENSEIGRYFCKFQDTHYVPNKMLARLYPQDTVITAKTTISEN